MIERGGLYWVDLGEARGSAPAYRRPVLVVQADPYNRSQLATALVVVVTSNTSLAGLPGNVFLPAAATGLPKDSVANVTAVATVDKDDLGEPAGVVPDYLMDDIDRGLRRVMAL